MKSILATARVLGSAVKYELVRLGNPRSLRGAALFAFFGAALLTLPAARHVVALAHPAPPAPPVPRLPRSGFSLFDLRDAAAGSPVTLISSSAWRDALLHRYSPMHGGGAWVVSGGVAGMVLPGAAAACAGAWLGATAAGYEYRCGNGLLTFVLLPRRIAVLTGKAFVAGCIGALLCLGATVFAYCTARLGFRGAGVQVALPLRLMLADPRAVALAALCGALGVIGGVVLRIRLLVTLVAAALCAVADAFLPNSNSLAVPYLANAAAHAVRFVPGTTYTAALILLPTIPLAALVLSGLVAARRRRVA